MTAQTIIDMARIYANMVGDTKLSDTQILTLVNEANRSFNNYLAGRKSKLIQTFKTFSVVAEQADYTIASSPMSITDFLRAGRLFNVAGEYEIREINEEQQYTKPSPFFYIKTNNTVLTLKPTPGSAESYKFFYYKIAADLALGDTPTILPVNLHELYALFVAMRLMVTDDRDHSNVKELYDMKYVEFQDYVHGTRQEYYDYTPSGEYNRGIGADSMRPVG